MTTSINSMDIKKFKQYLDFLNIEYESVWLSLDGRKFMGFAIKSIPEDSIKNFSRISIDRKYFTLNIEDLFIKSKLTGFEF
jgi:hypothetical protein